MPLASVDLAIAAISDGACWTSSLCACSSSPTAADAGAASVLVVVLLSVVGGGGTMLLPLLNAYVSSMCVSEALTLTVDDSIIIVIVIRNSNPTTNATGEELGVARLALLVVLVDEQAPAAARGSG